VCGRTCFRASMPTLLFTLCPSSQFSLTQCYLTLTEARAPVSTSPRRIRYVLDFPNCFLAFLSREYTDTCTQRVTIYPIVLSNDFQNITPPLRFFCNQHNLRSTLGLVILIIQMLRTFNIESTDSLEIQPYNHKDRR
jgi:hypothetical protein